MSIAEWTGVPLERVLLEVGIKPEARYVVLKRSTAGGTASTCSTRCPQTILAYGMNGGDLPVAHGAPLRLRVERKLGYKGLKFLHPDDRHGHAPPASRMAPASTVVPYGFPWYAGSGCPNHRLITACGSRPDARRAPASAWDSLRPDWCVRRDRAQIVELWLRIVAEFGVRVRVEPRALARGDVLPLSLAQRQRARVQHEVGASRL